MRAREIREAVKSLGGGMKGQRNFIEHIMVPLLREEKLPNGATYRKRTPDQWSIKALWEGFVGAVEDTLPDGLIAMDGRVMHAREAVNSTMFPVATGVLINAMVIDAYNSVPAIGDRLVRVMPSKLKTETIAGFTFAQGPEEVGEGDAYKDSSVGEKYVTTKASKKGRLINVTEETIIHDQTGQIMMRAQAIGEATRIEREKVIISGVTGADANVYKPSGVAEALYHSSNLNLVTSNGLDDWSAIETANIHHYTNVKDDRQGGNGEPILWMPNQLLVTPTNEYTARRIVNATEIRQTTNTNNVTISGNPVPNLEVLVTPFYSGTATDWFYGSFNRQFFWQEIYPIQTFAQGANSDLAFERDIVARFKVRYYGGIFCTDTVYVLKNTA